VQRCKEKESNEKSYVPVSNASSHPWAMVVMNFNTNPTRAAMEGPWWS